MAAKKQSGPSTTSNHRCEVCGELVSMAAWTSYFCPICNGHQDRMYRKEHRDPGYARAMSREAIMREYELAGMEWRVA